ncbi:uncharacterized protein LOC103031905 isoform X5 [Astyanax mexicanus]|uniref:uncharacterized protein LOC103031905 isoform X5 n=1 Tax=Astyanax mexicanus TaxID=7994 RepID=UPI0020CB456C|nr:uncharacterized protein LOC103031905 isoform X5 [Astyanax mexicanus]
MKRRKREKMDRPQKKKSAANGRKADERDVKSSSSGIRRSRSLERLFFFCDVPPDDLPGVPAGGDNSDEGIWKLNSPDQTVPRNT